MRTSETRPPEAFALRRLFFRRSLMPAITIALLTWALLSEDRRDDLLVLTAAMVVAALTWTLIQGVREYRDPYYCSSDGGDLVLVFFGGRTQRVLPDEIAAVSVVSGRVLPRDYSQYFLITLRDQSRWFLPPFLLDPSTSALLRQMAGEPEEELL